MPINIPGRCRQCGKKLPEKRPGKRCPECLKTERRRQQALRDGYRAVGLCTHCGGPRDDERLVCSSCRVVRNRSNAKRTARLKKAHLCWMCGEPAMEGHITCHLCTISNRERNRIAREDRKATGMCALCGKRKRQPGYSRCHYCRAKDVERKRTKRLAVMRGNEFWTKFRANPMLVAVRMEALMRGKPRQATGTAAD